MEKNCFRLGIVFILLTTVILTAQTPLERKLKLAESYEQAGQNENAIRLFEEVYNEKKLDAAFQGLVRSYRRMNMNSELLELMEERIETEKTSINYIILGEAYWKAGDHKKANSAWENAIDLADGNRNLYKELADIQSRLQLFPKAIETYKTAREEVSHQDNEIPFADELSRLYVTVGDYQNAIDETFILLEQSGNLPAVQARIYAVMQKEEAVPVIEERLKEYADNRSSNVLALELYSWFLKSTDNYEKALEFIIEADDRSDAGGRQIIEFAREADREGKLDIALKAYQEILDRGKENKHFSTATYSYTKALQEKLIFNDELSEENINEILSRYDKIIEEFPNTTTAGEAYLSKAKLLKDKLNRIDEAEETLNELVNKISNAELAGEASLELSDIYIRKGMLNEASEMLSMAVSRFGRSSPDIIEKARYELALVEYYRTNLDSAESKFNLLSKYKTSDVTNDVFEKLSIISDKRQFPEQTKLFAEAEYKLKRNDTSAAIERFKKISEEVDNLDTEIWQRSMINLATIAKDQNDIEKSNSFLKEYKSKLSDGIYIDKVIFMLAENYEDRRNTEKAIEEYKKILIDHANSIYLEDARKRIRALRGES